MMNYSLQHHGIPGQKWGERRYQNYDGTWTTVGKERRRGNSERGGFFIKRKKKEPLSKEELAARKEKIKSVAKSVGKIIAKTALKTAVTTGVVAAGGAAVAPLLEMFSQITMDTFRTGGKVSYWEHGTGVVHPLQGNIIASIVNTVANLSKYDWLDAYR